MTELKAQALSGMIDDDSGLTMMLLVSSLSISSKREGYGLASNPLLLLPYSLLDRLCSPASRFFIR